MTRQKGPVELAGEAYDRTLNGRLDELKSHPGKPEKIDVFVCIYDITDGQRLEWAKEAVQAWQGYAEDIRLWILAPGDDKWRGGLLALAETLNVDVSQIMGVSFLGDEFQRGRRIVAEGVANSPVYILADEDCVPVGKTFIARALEVMNNPKYREFAVLTPIPMEALIVDWTPEPEDYQRGTQTDERVMEHVDVGGIRVARKGVMGSDSSEWDEQPRVVHGVPISQSGAKYDRQHAIQIRQRGGRVGYIRALKMRHLGETAPVHTIERSGEVNLETV